MNNWMHNLKKESRSTTTIREIPYRGKYWSQKTTILGIRVLFWKLACNRAYGAKVQRRYHARLRKKALLQNVKITDATADKVTKLKEAMSKWRKYSKAEAEEDRKTLLQKKVTAISEENNTAMEKIMKQLRLREDQQRSATQIKIVRSRLRLGGISRVTYLDKNGVIHESTGRAYLEYLCNKANETKLQQTADTPFMTGALPEDVGCLGIGPAVCMMLDGTYDPPEKVDEYTKKFIKHLRNIARLLYMTLFTKSLRRNGSPSGKKQQSGRPVDVTYCILEHGKQDHSERPLWNWMLCSQTSNFKLDILLSDGV
jgi:hypothetical protein